MSDTKKILIIASVVYGMNAAIQAALGEQIVSWNDAPEEIKQSAIKGVQYHLANPDVTPEQSHDAWMKHRAATGWVYGEVKDMEAKTHPCMVPYGQLPLGQQMKDHIFRAAVHALKDLPLVEVQAAAAAPAPAPTVVAGKGFVAIQYVGLRETYKDGLYGTGLTFAKGQTLPVPAAAAVQMLRHPDVYRAGVLEAPAEIAAPADTGTKAAQSEKDQAEELAQDHRDAIGRMTTKQSVFDYVQQHFRQDLDKRKNLDALKAEAVQLLDRFGPAE